MTNHTPNRAVDFILANAFTRSQFGGNPAATVFLDHHDASASDSDSHMHNPSPEIPTRDATWMQNVALTLNQPIASLIFPIPNSSSALSPLARADDAKRPRDGEGTATLALTVGVRWFTTAHEVKLCGHGLLVAAYLLFNGFQPSIVSSDIASTLHSIQFVTPTRTVSARRVIHTEPQTGLSSERVEIELPLVNVVPVPQSEFERISGVVNRAFGFKHGEEGVDVRFVGCADEQGQKDGFGEYVMVELGFKDGEGGLGALKADPAIFKETAPYIVNIITSTSQNPSVRYETRMFAPSADVPEDHVCGSANCLTAPYWAGMFEGRSGDGGDGGVGVGAKGGNVGEEEGEEGEEEGEEMRVAHVSARRGELWTVVKRRERKVLLSGEVRVVARGKLDE